MKFSFDKKLGLGEILAFIAIIISFFTFFRGCHNEKIIKSNDFLIRAIQYRPQIIAIDTLEIQKISLIIDTIIPTSKGPKIEGYTTVNAKLSVKNIGDYKANIQAVISWDSLTFKDVLRDKLIKSDISKISKPENYSDRIFEIFPNETKSLDISQKLHSIKDDLFNLHIIILYSNDLLKINNLYDTYFWYEYKITSLLQLKEGMIFYSGMEFQIPNESVKLKDFNKSSKIYKIEEINKVIDTYEQKIKITY